MKNLINKGPAHCWSETMHKDYWNKMRQRTSGVAGRGGGNDIALKNAVEKRGPAKVTSKDALNVATNFLKGTGGIVASMLSTTKAQAGQNVRSKLSLTRCILLTKKLFMMAENYLNVYQQQKEQVRKKLLAGKVIVIL